MKNNALRFPTKVIEAEYYAIGGLTIDIAYPRSEPMEGAFYVLPPAYVKHRLAYEDVPTANCVGATRGIRNDCDVSASHKTHRWYRDAGVLLSGGGEITPFVECTETSYPLVNEKLASALSSSGLKGLQVVDAEMDYENSNRRSRDQVYLLSGENPLPVVPRRLRPGVVNKCRECGFAPIFCPQCGFVSDPCPQCQAQLIYVRLPGYNRAEMQFDLYEIFPEEINLAAGAIDLRRCDERWDFSGISTFSRRAFEFFAVGQRLSAGSDSVEDAFRGWTRRFYAQGRRSCRNLDKTDGLSLRAACWSLFSPNACYWLSWGGPMHAGSMRLCLAGLFG